MISDLQSYIFGPVRVRVFVDRQQVVKHVGVSPREAQCRLARWAQGNRAANDDGKQRTPPEAA